MKPARQIGFARNWEGPFVWFRLHEVPPIDELRSQELFFCVTGGLSSDEASDFIKGLGIEVTETICVADPRDPDGMLDTTMEGRIDLTIRRAIAKIAYSYLAHEYRRISAMDQFREIRRYVRFGEVTAVDPVTISTKHIIGGLPASTQIVAHVITVRWDPKALRVMAQVTLFGWVQYQVVLSVSKFFVPPVCIDSGHAFNPYGKQIMKLTRNRQLATQFPMMTKDEFA